MDIRYVLTDCDGVLTDGTVGYPDMTRKFHLRDGHGFELLHDADIWTAIISGESDESIEQRAEKLKTSFFSSKDKLKTAQDLMDVASMINHAAFMGDDIPDLELLNAVALPACPADAHIDVLRTVFQRDGFVSIHKGGRGAFRDFVDHILANG